jgi:PiT family inorganic phosphate transporter
MREPAGRTRRRVIPVRADPIALPLLIALIGIALLFDLLNGLHDAANSIATVVSTRVLSPQVAVFWAAFFNFIAFLIFSHAWPIRSARARSRPTSSMPRSSSGALMGAISWNLMTWGLGIPSSSSHALVGGLLGAGVPRRVAAIVWSGVLKTVAAIFLSPRSG